MTKIILFFYSDGGENKEYGQEVFKGEGVRVVYNKNR